MTPAPTPVPTLGAIALDASGCNGGTVLGWSALSDPRFAKYVVLRASTASVPTTWPTAAAAKVGWTSDPSARTAGDAGAPVGSAAYYRVLAIDAADRTIAVSPVRSATAKPVKALGTLAAVAADGGATQLSWTPYGGIGACFTWYKVVASETNPAPSYLFGDPQWAAVAEQGTTSAVTDAPVSGTTYFVRVQAIGATALGAFVVAQSEVLTYTVP